MKKIIFLISLFLISLSQVFAYNDSDTFYSDYKFPNMFVTKIKDGKLMNTATYMLRRSDSNYVYCIDPFTFEISGTYNAYINAGPILGLTNEQINRMNLIAHYGYGYTGHTDIKWYGVTQYMIWQTLNLDDIYYTDTLNGNKVELYQNEINEINNLVNRYYTKPSFTETNFDLSIGIENTLIDNNEVLQYYDIEYYDPELQITKDGSQLIVYSDNPGTYNIRLRRKADVTNDYILYVNDTSQNMFYPGRYDDVETSLSVTFYEGKINIFKQDSETTTPQGQATLGGAIYGLYNENDELVDQITLDENGYGVFDHLSFNKYYVQEIEASNGYQLDETKYKAHIWHNYLFLNLKVYENVIKNNIKIIKMYGNKVTDNYHLESDVSFELYDNLDNLIDTYTTDENGEINLELPYGSYTLKQINGMDRFTISEPIEINVTEMTDDIEIVIKDDEIIEYGNLEVKKIGDDGKLLDGVTFNVYASNNITSLSGDIYYQAGDLVGEITIHKGYGYLKNLYYGKYYLVETNTSDGYILNDNPLEVDINEDIVTVEVINQHYDIPNTGKNDINYSQILSNLLIMIGLIFSIYEIKKIYINH